jgi:short subunit dehydrogenase-like uncharacterized protein
MNRPLDVIVFGATGFTGRLVAEYLLATQGVGRGLRWALAGRSQAKLEAVREEIGAPAALPLITTDARDATALAALVRKTRVVITTVGPYTLLGEPLLAACAAAGTDCVDLCGEPLWMADMISRHHATAQASGARIVHSCGFDSIPFDLGVLFLQTAANRRWGAPLPTVHGLVRVMKGAISGGTAASLLATVQAIARQPALSRTLADPFALTPGPAGPYQPDSAHALFDPLAPGWTAPFVMAAINTKNVHRTNALRGHAYGRDFVYAERELKGDGPAGHLRAKIAARRTRLQNALLGLAPARALIRRFALPAPGKGPSPAQQQAGRYELLFVGQAADGRSLRAVVKGDRDPGYGSTSKMVSESALCLLHDVDRSATPGGLWTPAAAMGLALVERLRARAGLSFELET